MIASLATTYFFMSGHSKWSNIKNKKAAVDKVKGSVFSKLSRNIRVVVREGGSGDPSSNANLRLWLDKARSANMPKANVQRAIDAGLGKGANGAMKETVYEGFGPQGVGMMIVALTDNGNRTTSEIRNILSKAGGSLGSPNSVKYMFVRNEAGEYECKIPLPLRDEKHKEKMEQLIEQLFDQEDVEDVYCAVPELNK